MSTDTWRTRATRVAPYLILLLVALLMGATYPRDDTGTPAAQCSFIGSTGVPTLCSTTDPLPTGGAPTQSTTDPTGFGKAFFNSNNPFVGLGPQPVFVTDQTVLAFTSAGGPSPNTIKTFLSTNGGRTYALSSTSTAAFNVTDSRDAFRTTGGLFILGMIGTAGSDGYLSSSDGVSWAQVDLPGVTGAIVNSIAQQGTTVLVSLSVGGNLQVCRSTDSGSSFSSCSDPGALVLATNQANTLASPSANIWLASDGSGNVARSTDDGVTFTGVLVSGAGVNTLTCVSATICLAAQGGTISRSTNAGATFTTALSVSTSFATFRTLLNFGSGVVVALSSIPTGAPTLYRSADFGVTWGLASTLPASTSPNGSAKANGGRAVVGTSNQTQIIYSPIIGAGETIVAGQSGNRWDIDANGRGETLTVLTDSTQANIAGVTAGGRLTAVTIDEAAAQRTCSEPAANTAATVSVTGVASQRIILYDYIAFYTTAPAAAQTLTVTSAAVNVWLDIVNGANTPTQRSFSAGLLPTDGNTLTVTLPAGGAGVVGKLCATVTGPFIR